MNGIRSCALVLLLVAAEPARAADDAATCTPPGVGALEVVDAYMESFNAAEAEAHAATLHYPSFRVNSAGHLAVHNTQQDYAAQFRAGRPLLPWHHTRFDSKKIVQESAHKAHVAVHFTRYLKDGTKRSEHDSLYIVVCRKGRWGIVARSSFVPVVAVPKER